MIEANLWLDPPRGYAFADPSNIPNSPIIDIINAEESYHKRAILLSLSYVLVEK